MAKKRVAEEIEESEVLLSENLEPDEVERALAGLPSDTSHITLYRVREEGGRPRFIAKLSPGEFDLELIKNAHGGGKFNYVAVRNGIEVGRGTFEIEGESIIFKKPQTRGDGNEPPVEYASRDAALTTKLDEVIRTLTAPRSSELTELVKVLLVSLVQSKSTSGEDVEGKMLERLITYKNLFTPSGQGSDLNLVLGAVKEGLALGSGGEASPWMIFAEKFIPVLERSIDKVVEERKRVVPVSAVRPSPPQLTGASPEFMVVAPMLRPYLPAMILSASHDGNPGAWADIIEPLIPSESKEKCRTWLQGETWFRDLCACDVRIQAQAAWWGELRELLLKGPEAPREPETEEAE